MKVQKAVGKKIVPSILRIGKIQVKKMKILKEFLFFQFKR